MRVIVKLGMPALGVTEARAGHRGVPVYAAVKADAGEVVKDSRTAEGGVTSNRRSPSWLPHLLLAALVCASGGCHNLRSQLKALTGADTTGAGAGATSGTSAERSAGSHSVMPRAYGSKPPSSILDQTFHLRHDPAERDAGPEPRVPRFDWSGHDGRVAGALGDGARHGRGS